MKVKITKVNVFDSMILGLLIGIILYIIIFSIAFMVIKYTSIETDNNFVNILMNIKYGYFRFLITGSFFGGIIGSTIATLSSLIYNLISLFINGIVVELEEIEKEI